MVGCDVCERKSEMIMGLDVIFCLDVFFLVLQNFLSFSGKNEKKTQLKFFPNTTTAWALQILGLTLVTWVLKILGPVLVTCHLLQWLVTVCFHTSRLLDIAYLNDILSQWQCCSYNIALSSWQLKCHLFTFSFSHCGRHVLIDV